MSTLFQPPDDTSNQTSATLAVGDVIESVDGTAIKGPAQLGNRHL